MQSRYFTLIQAFLFSMLIASSGSAAIDLTGWTLIQEGGALTNSIPFGVSIQDNSYLVIARGDGNGGPSRADFEEYWQISLDPDVVYLTGDSLGGSDDFPQIGGEETETYKILNLIQQVVDGPTSPDIETRISSTQRLSLNTNADEKDAWLNRTYDFASPGYGCEISGSQSRLVISEIADASNNDFEYLELFYGVPAGDDTTPATPRDAYIPSICDTTRVRVVFNENINPISGSEPLNYEVAPDAGTPVSAVVEGNAVLLTFAAPLSLSQPYTVQIENVEDDAGNPMPGIESVDVFCTPLFVNEILYDPLYDFPFGGTGGDANGDGTPSSSEDEFVEYINISGSVLDLSGYTMNDDGEIRLIIPNGTLLMPGQALVIFGGGTPIGSFGNAQVITATDGLGLGNGGDLALLRNAEGRLVARETFEKDQSDDESLQRLVEFPDNGWDEQCGLWVKHSTIAAAANRRFSPGTRVDGSFFPGTSTTAPEILGARMVSPCDLTQVILTFSMPMDQVTGSDVSRYSIGSLGQPNDAVVLNNTIILDIDGLQYWDRHTITIDGVEDSKGTPTAPGAAVDFVAGSLVINEVLYNPPSSELGDANRDGFTDPSEDEFVELVNNGAAPVDLAGLRILDSNRERFVFPEDSILAPGQAAVVFGGGNPAQFNSTFGGSLVFAVAEGDDLGLSNSSDSVIIQTADGLVLTQMSYTTDSPGMSLNLSPERVCGLYFLHQWVAGSAGTPFSPGRQASGLPHTGGIDYITGPPVMTDAFAADPSTIWVWFNEEVEQTSAENPMNYNIQNGPMITSATLDYFEKRVELSLTAPLAEDQEYTLSANNISDLFSNTGTNNGSWIIVYQAPPDVIINEILFDVPNTGGDANQDGVSNGDEDEFVEIVNNEDYPVDISLWTLSDLVAVRHTFPEGTVLQPGEPIVIFAGGVPSGNFGGAKIQLSSTGELRLGSSGDCVTLSDSYGRPIEEVCWNEGDFVEMSMVRSPEKTGMFVPHISAPGSSGRLFSPGTQVNGTAFDFSNIIAPVIIAIEKGDTENSLKLSFTGEPGPFVVEKTSNLAQPEWEAIQDAAFTGPSQDGLRMAEFSVPAGDNSGYVRIRQQ